MRNWAFGLIVGATLLAVACGQENPSATSSDDTHSISQSTILGENVATSTSPSVQTTVIEGESALSQGSTTNSEEVASEIVTSSVVNGQTPTTTPADVAVSGSAPVTSAAPSMAQPTPTIAPECDAMPSADCRNVDLRGRELFYANFQGANLSGAIMSGMDLTGADFTGANLTGANLIGATLDYAYFFGANLTGAQLTRVSMSGIVWDDTTIWPAGFVPPDF